ncbi:NAD-dependent epimerase/dehydratase family protein [Sinosporangium siamense]|uniref:NAD-dependent epimerase n=1 Tax=Sinosporangium siamense TaxID=1367973 RepID=A0A919RC25_9ACTN|nr:NAD-dependent epimerase/dehydratase family protein [Sinosporangium siamense]GII90687.1 NAD-dependent epimerase [Sinosporangium siamense]
MEIVGNGFLAHHLQQIADAHPDVLVLAAGVSLWKNSDDDYERETELVQKINKRCVLEGRTLVFLSTASMSMYGAPGCSGREDEEIVPVTPYGWHKLKLEQLVRDSGVKHLILRLGYVVGPGGPANRLMPALIDQMTSGSVTVYRQARRDIIYVDDWVSLLDKILTAGITHEVLNMASGQSVPISLILDHLEHRLGLAPKRNVIDEGTEHWISVEKLRRVLPSVTDEDYGPEYYRSVIDRYLESTGLLGDGSPASGRR